MTMSAQEMSAVFDAAKYGLTKSSATASDHDKGIVKGPDGSFYSIDGFKRNKKEGLDKDAGDVFSSSLEADSGIEVTTFNTATDVEGALAKLSTAPEEVATDDGPYTQSETLSEAKAGTKAYEDVILPHTGDYTTGKKTDMHGDYLNAYKLNLAKEMEPVDAAGDARESKIQEEKDKVAGLGAIDGEIN